MPIRDESTVENSPVVNNLVEFEELEDKQLADCVRGTAGINLAEQLLEGQTLDGLLAENPIITFDSQLPPLTIIAACPNPLRACSDRAIKESFAEIDVQQVLEKVVDLPLTTWKYKQEQDDVRHLGPMAQDFAATFGLGDSDRSIYMVDANGVNLAAIQALYKMIQERDAELSSIKAEMQALKQQVQVTA